MPTPSPPRIRDPTKPATLAAGHAAYLRTRHNLAEQPLKLSVRYRNNSLFYKNQHCAFVGDVLSSLINGGTAGRGSENKVPFSTTRTAR